MTRCLHSIRAAVGSGLLLVAVIAPATAGTFTAYGPHDFKRATGAPQTEHDTFKVKNPAVPYRIRIDNGGTAGTMTRVNSATVILNGTVVIRESDFNSSGATRIEKSVTVSPLNNLDVQLQGQAGDGFSLSILGEDNDPPKIVASVAPAANAAGWNRDSVTVTFTCDDPTSDIASCTAPVVVTAEGANQVVTGTAVDTAGNRASGSVSVNIDKTPPLIAVTSPPARSAVNHATATISGTVSEALSGVVSVKCGASVATLTGSSFQCSTSLVEGSNFVDIMANDGAENEGHIYHTLLLDTQPPQVSISHPAEGTTNAASVVVGGDASDPTGIASVKVNGKTVTLNGDAFETTVDLAEGANSIQALALDNAGNASSAVLSVTRFVVPTIVVTTPSDLSVVSSATISVRGNVANAVSVDVNGIAASVSGSTFSADNVPLAQGRTVITATARTASGHVAAQSIFVYRDAIPPTVSIAYPLESGTLYAPSVTVSGMVDDIAIGTVNSAQARVSVNGLQAEVANRAFVVRNVPLVPGANTLTVTATDQAGNGVTTTRHVTFDATSNEPRISVASGDSQTGIIASPLGQPIVARLTTATGGPAANQPVTFRVVENNGTVKVGSTAARAVIATSDASGLASAIWTLGTHSGTGNEVVEATAPNFIGVARFVATAQTASPALIVVDSGSNQFGIVGEPLPRPVVAVVTDGGSNRIAGIPVTFTVLQGSGHFDNGSSSITVTTDSDGRAWAMPRLGSDAGENVFEGSVDGISNTVAFTATGRIAGAPEQTKISGVVFDNTNAPIGGVTVRIEGTAMTAQTATTGQFTIGSAPVGYVKLLVDGSTAQRPGTWPTLEFAMFTLPGQNNTLGMPIYLLPIDVRRGVFVDEVTGGTLTIPEFPGFSMTIKPGSVTFPGGSRTGTISATLVHSDKVPMPPGFGQQPRFIVTIQPVGAHFDPPAAITFPNVDGMTPGEITELYSFDHDLGQFVAIGTGTVADDGTVIRSDPGVGIIKAGWHCGGNPAASGTAHRCPECKKCMNNVCIPDYGADPSRCCKGQRYNSTTSCCNVVEGPQPKYPIADLAKCPGRVAHPGFTPTVDGCSDSPENPMLQPGDPPDGITCQDKNQAPPFTPACDDHDRCFQTCNSDKQNCDDQFFNGLRRDICGPLTDTWCRTRCFYFANLYSAILSAVPASGPYTADQKKACQCCP